ncbi:hypothetical protein Hypma_002262 [Hypsizygus marmoreus]|uniref:Uncharacterized protein n=1 Tax=Hypsizygus marmoreus TaxID=39966 RepID=A0A369K082_HYPMA|nr:hypothetical protein Hypma_002262 [Hypsizygus marmoreus]
MDIQTPPRIGAGDRITSICTQISGASPHDEKLFLALAIISRGFVHISDIVSDFPSAQHHGLAVSLRESVVITSEAISFLLPPHDDDAHRVEPIVLRETGDVDDPLRAMTQYLTSRDNSFPLRKELWLCENGTSPTYPWFQHYIRRFFPPVITLHRFRVGGAATRTLASGRTSAKWVENMGHWPSD